MSSKDYSDDSGFESDDDAIAVKKEFSTMKDVVGAAKEIEIQALLTAKKKAAEAAATKAKESQAGEEAVSAKKKADAEAAATKAKESQASLKRRQTLTVLRSFSGCA